MYMYVVIINAKYYNKSQKVWLYLAEVHKDGILDRVLDCYTQEGT